MTSFSLTNNLIAVTDVKEEGPMTDPLTLPCLVKIVNELRVSLDEDDFPRGLCIMGNE